MDLLVTQHSVARNDVVHAAATQLLLSYSTLSTSLNILKFEDLTVLTVLTLITSSLVVATCFDKCPCPTLQSE